MQQRIPFGERSESKASRLHRKTCLAPSNSRSLGGALGELKKKQKNGGERSKSAPLLY
jgi:hypothetical protein